MLPSLSVRGSLKIEAQRHHAVFSVQDTSGNVVIEALGNGVPVVALNHQGSQVMLKHGGGILIDITSYDQVVSSFRDAIVGLDANRDRLSHCRRGVTSG